METVTIIVLGVVAITVVSVLGDMFSKIAQAKIQVEGSGREVSPRARSRRSRTGSP